MGAGNPTSGAESSNLEALLGISANPSSMGAQPAYGDPSAFGANAQVPQQQYPSQGTPGSAFYSFNQQWNAHFGIGGAVDPMQHYQPQQHQQQQQQQQLFMQQMSQQAQPTNQQTMAQGAYQVGSFALLLSNRGSITCLI